MIYKTKADPRFLKKYVKLVKKDNSLEKRINKTILQLEQNPKHPGLRTHQINDPDYGKIWRS